MGPIRARARGFRRRPGDLGPRSAGDDQQRHCSTARLEDSSTHLTPHTLESSAGSTDQLMARLEGFEPPTPRLKVRPGNAPGMRSTVTEGATARIYSRQIVTGDRLVPSAAPSRAGMVR